MYDKLTENDIKKMQEEIDYRKLVVRPKRTRGCKKKPVPRAISAKTLSTKLPNRTKNRNESRIRYLEKMIKPLTLFQIPQRTMKSASTIPSRFTSKKMMRQKPTNLSPPFVVILSKDTSVSTRH